MIYLDNAATTPIDPRVAKAMGELLITTYGNASSKFYQQSEDAKKIVGDARDRIASFLTCKPNEVVFTGGATESNNLIIKGITFPFLQRNEKVHLVTSKVEHKATLETCRELEKFGVEVTYLDVDEYGRVNYTDLKNALTENTKLVSLIWGNNELGSLNPIEEIAIILNLFKIPFHVDGTQVYGKRVINLSKVPIDFLSFSAHKVYGPKGIGGCFIRRDQYDLLPEITPLIHGGQQEFGLRAGTECIHNILGLGLATEIAQNEMKEYIESIIKLESEFIREMNSKIPSASINSPLDQKVPGILSVTISDLNSELFLKWASSHFALSTGSACALGEKSHVLSAVSKGEQTEDTIRVSFGKFTEIDSIKLVDTIIQYLHEYSL